MSQDSMIVRCGKCGTRNRIPKKRVHDGPRCGKCGTGLESVFNHRPVTVTNGNFGPEVISSPGVVLVDCWAPWCGPCRTVGPIMDALADQYAGQVKIAKLNVDENARTASQYGIQSIPTMLFFKKGAIVDQLVGAVPRAEIESRLQAIL